MLALAPLALGLAAIQDRPNLDAALQVERWLHHHAIFEDDVRWWPAVPNDSPSEPNESTRASSDLYHGSSGIALFYLELHAATGHDAFRGRAIEASRGIEKHLASELHPQGTSACGLYTGVAGAAWTAMTLAEAFDDPASRQLADRGVRHLLNRAKRVDDQISWNESTDIISGSAGIGLALLDLAPHYDVDAVQEAYREAAQTLLAAAVETEDGLLWKMAPNYPRRMPNFSHGTAGVAYFLARVARITSDKELLTAARRGADLLLALEAESGLVCHHLPGGDDLFYLGWCHGPPGTGRLYYELWQQTGEARYLEAIERTGEALLKTSIPDVLEDGFWNNVSVCCGSAGVASYCLDLYRVTNNRDYLTRARHLTNDLLARGRRDEHGLRWPQCEHRVRPDLVQAQTGYAQGAAGIGLWLLRLDAFDQERPFQTTLPDSPFSP